MKFVKSKILWLLLGLVSIVALYLILVLSFWLYAKSTVYPGISIAGVSLTGKTKEEARKVVEEKIKAWEGTGISLNIPGKNVVIVTPAELGITWDIPGTVDNAIKTGANNPFFLGGRRNIGIIAAIDPLKTEAKIAELAKTVNTPVINSTVTKKDGAITVNNGTMGLRVNYAQSAANLKDTAANLRSATDLSVFSIPPTFTSADLEENREEITEKTKNGLVLLDGATKYPLTTEELVSFVELARPRMVYASMMEGDSFYAPIFSASVGKSTLFSANLISGYLLGLSGKINSEPVNAKLSISGDRATIFVPEKNGRNLNISESSLSILTALSEGKAEATLTIETIKPEVNAGSLNDMGIVELIATGSSNFSGSPTNRRHNIKVGAARFNGILIKPDEEFSFIQKLGPVDASTGYLPELVIKENKTIPEYGGGMCQVSSTAFRAALNSGLPIISRTPHSYPVSYYKPYGVDATVYIPKPDLVFKNDTGKYILVQTRISGNNLYFDFYGTKPQRTVTFAGNEAGTGAVYQVEKVTPYLYDQGVRGNNSFTALVYRFIHDSTGKLVKTNKFVSKYDTPDNYPH